MNSHVMGTWSKAAAIRRQQLSMARCSLWVRAHSGGAFAEPCSAARARAHEMPGACLHPITVEIRPKITDARKGSPLGQGSGCPIHPARLSSPP